MPKLSPTAGSAAGAGLPGGAGGAGFAGAGAGVAGGGGGDGAFGMVVGWAHAVVASNPTTATVTTSRVIGGEHSARETRPGGAGRSLVLGVGRRSRPRPTRGSTAVSQFRHRSGQ